jgi:hypothetical protein
MTELSIDTKKRALHGRLELRVKPLHRRRWADPVQLDE